MLSDLSGGQLTEERDVPEIFNEIDTNGDPDSSWIRNIVNFTLYDDSMQPLPFSALGEGKPTATLVGELVLPLPAAFRQRILNTSCTVAQQLIPESFGAVAPAGGVALDVLPHESDTVAHSSVATGPTLAPWFDTESFFEQVSSELC